MIQKGTKFVVIDNSGAKEAECIGFFGSSKLGGVSIGDKVKVAVKVSASDGSIKRGAVSKAIIVRTRGKMRRKNGECIGFGDNAVALLNDDDSLRGTRVFGPVARELKRCFPKLASLANEVV